MASSSHDASNLPTSSDDAPSRTWFVFVVALAIGSPGCREPVSPDLFLTEYSFDGEVLDLAGFPVQAVVQLDRRIGACLPGADIDRESGLAGTDGSFRIDYSTWTYLQPGECFVLRAETTGLEPPQRDSVVYVYHDFVGLDTHRSTVLTVRD